MINTFVGKTCFLLQSLGRLGSASVLLTVFASAEDTASFKASYAVEIRYIVNARNRQWLVENKTQQYEALQRRGIATKEQSLQVLQAIRDMETRTETGRATIAYNGDSVLVSTLTGRTRSAVVFDGHKMTRVSLRGGSSVEISTDKNLYFGFFGRGPLLPFDMGSIRFMRNAKASGHDQRVYCELPSSFLPQESNAPAYFPGLVHLDSEGRVKEALLYSKGKTLVERWSYGHPIKMSPIEIPQKILCERYSMVIGTDPKSPQFLSVSAEYRLIGKVMPPLPEEFEAFKYATEPVMNIVDTSVSPGKAFQWKNPNPLRQDITVGDDTCRKTDDDGPMTILRKLSIEKIVLILASVGAMVLGLRKLARSRCRNA